MKMATGIQKTPLTLANLNFVRLLVVLAIAFGYASTMPLGPDATEKLAHLGYDPSWIGIQSLFFFSGVLALRSLRRHGSETAYLKSRILRNFPLLALFTLITVAVIYPAFGVMNDDLLPTIKKLAVYYFETVTCIDPGRVLPGLLDEAKYMCLIQGAIWTFKWGLVLHIGTVIAHRLRLLNHDVLIVFYAGLATLLYFGLVTAKVKFGVVFPDFILTFSHLLFPFLWGMAVFAKRDELPQTPTGKLFWLGLFGGLALFNYIVLPWTPAIELLLTAFWIYAAWILLTTHIPALAWISGTPDLTLSVYLINWPTAQLLLLQFPSLSPWALIMMSLPVTLALSYVTHLLLSGRLFKWVAQLEKSVSRPPSFSQA